MPECLVGNGRTPTIDITILPDGQPFMDSFVEGVLADFQLTRAEEKLVAKAERVHTVLVDSLVAEMTRLNEIGVLTRPFVSADFLDFRHFTVERFKLYILSGCGRRRRIHAQPCHLTGSV